MVREWSQEGTRRRLLRLATLPVLAVLGAFASRSEGLVAEHPVRRVQERQANQRRRRRRRRLEQRREAERRDLGDGNGGR